jgi:hypothetical protein
MVKCHSGCGRSALTARIHEYNTALHGTVRFTSNFPFCKECGQEVIREAVFGPGTTIIDNTSVIKVEPEPTLFGKLDELRGMVHSLIDERDQLQWRLNDLRK